MTTAAMIAETARKQGPTGLERIEHLEPGSDIEQRSLPIAQDHPGHGLIRILVKIHDRTSQRAGQRGCFFMTAMNT